MDKYTAIYVRVSTRDQRHDSQLRELHAFCRLRGWKKILTYCEKESGAKTSRPQLDKLMKDMRAGKVVRLVAFKLDRLGRSLTHLALMLDEMNRLCIPLLCSSQGIDTSADNPAGKLQLGVLMAVAEFERSLIRERVHAGLAAARACGIRLGRPRTLPMRSAEVRRLRTNGLSIRAIASKLNMPPSSVALLLKSPKR